MIQGIDKEDPLFHARDHGSQFGRFFLNDLFGLLTLLDFYLKRRGALLDLLFQLDVFLANGAGSHL